MLANMALYEQPIFGFRIRTHAIREPQENYLVTNAENHDNDIIFMSKNFDDGRLIPFFLQRIDHIARSLIDGQPPI
jgi:hypothetical protein